MRQVNDHPFTSLFNYCHTIHQNLWRPHQFLILQSEMIALKDTCQEMIKDASLNNSEHIWNTQDIYPNCLQLRTLTAFCLPKLWSNQTKQSYSRLHSGRWGARCFGSQSTSYHPYHSHCALPFVGGNVGWREIHVWCFDGWDGWGGHFRLVCFSFSGKNDVFVRFNAARSTNK